MMSLHYIISAPAIAHTRNLTAVLWKGVTAGLHIGLELIDKQPVPQTELGSADAG